MKIRTDRSGMCVSRVLNAKGWMMNAFPMIERCMHLQKGCDIYKDGDYVWVHYGYAACPDCSHEVVTNDNTMIYDCGWCNKKAIAAVWMTVNNEGVSERDGSPVNLNWISYADA